ncbi:calcium ion binding protein [Aureococcus anophagefferens]|nr:calcium ion binding protein [Aureococcus anophagefferens]
MPRAYSATASSECTTCEVGTYSDDGSDTCTLCSSGYSSAAEGASECAACPVGKYKGAGAGACVDCDVAKYADEAGSSDCKLAAAGTFISTTGASASTPCPAGTYSATAAEECTICATGCYSCLEDYYFSPFAVDLDDGGSVPCDDSIKLLVSCAHDSTKCFDQCCLSCERGMDCENATSNTLTAVPIEDGWWRASSYSDDVYQCQYSGACKKGECAEGHEGVACRVCKNDYHHDALKNRCVECKGTSYPGSASQIAIGLLIAFLSMQVYAQPPLHRRADDNLASVGNAQIVLVFIASLMLFIKDMDEQDGAPGDMFKGPIFSYAMIVIGTLVLVATIYTILVETCELRGRGIAADRV